MRTAKQTMKELIKTVECDYTNNIWHGADLSIEEFTMVANKLGYKILIGITENCYQEKERLFVFRNNKTASLLKIAKYSDYVVDKLEWHYTIDIIYDKDHPSMEEVIRNEYLSRCR